MSADWPYKSGDKVWMLCEVDSDRVDADGDVRLFLPNGAGSVFIKPGGGVIVPEHAPIGESLTSVDDVERFLQS